MIGSDPDLDRFPSTSTAKTTVSDIEIILDEGDYSAIVTFASEHVVLANIEECVADACVAAWEGKKDGDIAERLLNHRDQRFRLGYTLGWYTDDHEIAEDDGFSFELGENSIAPAVNDDDTVSPSDREKNSAVLKEYLRRIKGLRKEGHDTSLR